MLAVLIAAAVALPTPAQLPTIPRLIQQARPVFCAGTYGRDLAITFDDGPSPYTLRLVRVLRRAHVRATFFDVGSRIRIWPDAARASTHFGELGNHTWTHPPLTRLSLGRVDTQLVETQAEIGEDGGGVPRLFRPPYGEATTAIDRIARRLELLDVRWSVDSGDSLPGASARSVRRAALAGLRPGAIILLHDPHPWTASVARALFRVARRRGLRPVTVSKLLATQPPTAHQLDSTGTERCPVP